MSLPCRCLSVVFCLAFLPGWSAVAAPPARAEKTGPRLDRHGDPLPPGAIARLGTLRLYFGGGREAVAFSPDGKFVATVDVPAKGVRLWDAATGRSLHLFAVSGDHAPSLPVFSADGKRLAAAVLRDIHVWDVAARRQVRRLRVTHAPDGRLVFCGADTTVAVSSNDGLVSWWDIPSGKLLRKWDPLAGRAAAPAAVEASVNGRTVAIPSPDGRTLAAHVTLFASAKERRAGLFREKNFLVAWDTVRGKELWRADDGKALAFSPDGRLLAAEQYGVVVVRETTTGKQVRSFRGQIGLGTGLAFSGDGRLLATAASGWNACLWDVRSGKLLRRFEGSDGLGSGKAGPWLSLSADGKRLAVAVGGVVRLYDTATGKERPRFEGHRTAVGEVAFAPDGRSLVSGGEACSRWDTRSWRELRCPTEPSFASPYEPAVVLGGGLFFTPDANGSTVLADRASGMLKQRLPARGEEPGRVGILSGDCKVVVLVENDDKGDSVIVCDAATGKELRRQSGLKRVKWLVAPHSRLVAWVTEPELFERPLYLWDGGPKVRVPLKEGEKQEEAWSGVGDSRLVFAPGGRIMATARTMRMPCGFANATYSHTLALFDPRACKRLHTLGFGEATLGMAFSPDGKMLATTHRSAGVQPFLDLPAGPLICLWKVETGNLRRTFSGHVRPATCVAFSPDGKLLASGSEDATVLVWDVYSSKR